MARGMVEQLATLDIEIYAPTKDGWAQARYLVHGYDDVLWTDDLESAIAYLKESCDRIKEEVG